MKYKLLLVDIDGTLTPNLGLPPCKYSPSQRVLDAFKTAVTKINVSLCTGRDKDTVIMICKKLRLKSPQIIEGGAKIIDVQGNTLWVRYISQASSDRILAILKTIKTAFSIVVDGVEYVNKIPVLHPDKITAVLLYELNQTQVDSVKKRLSSCTDLAFAVNRDRSGNTIYITDRFGTKACGVHKLMEMLQVKKTAVIGVGDGNNDKVMLLESGLKVAMANAVDEIKAVADYIAPGVDQEGIVDVLEKFALNQ
ncbi:Cof-type HAD-IIB family hydrolase [Patescibacteria group bacterium]|nr:Cof-type HAD-IIB family hydrolase [Patescibacteria group bacterium]MCL5091315.1 Cof-type HAD-IIB family hydrolase [Patescibacteria group bacterium]